MKKLSGRTIGEINQLHPSELEKHGVLEKARYGHICPFCQNGSGRDGTGISPIKNRDGEDNSNVVFHCFKCGKTFNNLQILRNHYGIDNFAELIEKTCSNFDIKLEYVDFDAPAGKRKKSKRRDEKPIDERTLAVIHEDLATSTDTLKKYIDAVKTWRGLPLDTLLKFNCRLIWQWTAPTSRHSTTYTPYLQDTSRMIIPCSDDSYLARMIAPASNQKAKEFFKDKEKMHAGHKNLFNPDALKSAAPVFCVEGYIDAMSIDFAGFNAVALGAAARGDLLVDTVAKMQKKPQIIILLDSDATGRENAPKILEELIGLNCPAVVRFLSDSDSKIDCNQILDENGVDELRNRLADIVNDSVAELAAIQADFDEKKKTRATDNDLNSLFKGNDSDLTFARRLEKFCGSDLRWLTDDEQWITYQNGIWIRGSEKNSCVAHCGRALADTLTKYAATNAEKDLAEKFQSSKKISGAITLLKTLDSIRIKAEDLDRHSNLLNCLNGVVDLETGFFYPSVEKRSALINQQCRAAIVKDATSELVTKFFEDIQPDEMTRRGLLRWLGYCLTGENCEEKFLIWFGRGSNGKGVLGSALLELLGDYGTGLSQRALLRNSIFSDDANKPSTSLNCLEKRRFALSEELPQKADLNIELVKNLTGGDRLAIRPLYHEERTIKNFAKINISGNFLPTIENVADLGLKRRLLQIPFNVQFGGASGKPIDYNLKRKMLLPENLSALLFLLIREAKAWYRRDDGGLIISDFMKQATQAHLDAENFVADFIDDSEKFVRVKGATVKAKDFITELKNAYPTECAKFKRNDLTRYISSVGGVEYIVDNHNRRVFKGIGKLGDTIAPDTAPPPAKQDDATAEELDLPF